MRYGVTRKTRILIPRNTRKDTGTGKSVQYGMGGHFVFFTSLLELYMYGGTSWPRICRLYIKGTSICGTQLDGCRTLSIVTLGFW